MISLEKVEYQTKDKNILKNINLDLESGKKYLLLGPSGSGKTSLLKILNNLISISSGKISLNNISYEEINPTILRKKISLIMQDSILFGKTVRDNFEYINSLNNLELNELEFIDFLSKLKMNKDFFYQDINELSGGEKQRISIIRTIMNSPDYILADEPFSALDKSRINILFQMLIDLVEKNNVGLVIISHYFEEIIHSFDQVIFLFNGEIVFYGKPDKFLLNTDKRILNFLGGIDE